MPRGGRSPASVSASPVVVTQFAVPSPPFGMIERPRLSERLRTGLTEPVTLVCAPAGSGKTALVAAEVRSGAYEHVAWITLEPGDDEPGRLWDAVLSALELAGAVPADSPLAALAAPVPESRDAFMPLLVNAIAALPEPVVLVLDDAHLLRSRECLAQLSFLLLHTPDTLRLVLTARSDPPLPLHVMRVRGRLVEIRAADLAFTLEEATELLAVHGLELSEDLVRALHARTEGWGAGLRLAALSLQGHDDPEAFVAEFAGDDRVVGDYLLAEVLDRQPARLRGFLLRTSLVERVCGGLADAMTGDSHGADTLATLERTNGFVLGIDAHGEWFRYHRLFARLVRVRAEREIAGELPQLHSRAARWYADAGRRASTRSSTRSPRATGTSPSRSSPSTGSTSTCAATRPPSGRSPPRSRPSGCGPTPSSPPRSPARRSTSATPTRRSCTSRTPRPRPRASPLRAAAATWRRWRWPGSPPPGCTATSRARSRPPTSCSRRPRRTAAASTTRVRRSCTRCSARPRCGGTGSTARARSSRRPSRWRG